MPKYIFNDYWLWILKHFQYLCMKSFGKFTKGSVIEPPFLIRNREGIFLGERIMIRKRVRIEVIKNYAGNIYDGRLEIGDDSILENDVHITAASSITIGKKVLIAPRVVIVDCDHGYQKLNLPIMDQSLITSSVSVGDESWIGAGAILLKGTRIGKHCVIGANSVVNGIIPDYSIAAGNPAKVLKTIKPDTDWD